MSNKHQSLKPCSGGTTEEIHRPRLIKALGHPIREHTLAVFNERIASATEIGEEIGLDVSAFYTHVTTLEEMGFIERIETRRRRGAKERFWTPGVFDVGLARARGLAGSNAETSDRDTAKKQRANRQDG
jgi:DNA-binding transcriptional ArsR family regulator